MAAKIALVDPVLGPLSDDRLTPDVRVYQRARGHRFSSDDVATAFFAWRARPDARRVVDLGCGLGSVLLLLAWKMPEAALVGVEAQDSSFTLLERNVARSGFGARVLVAHGDLRDPGLVSGQFDLVTGTPPYFPGQTALDAADPQRALARIEYRGGVEAYVAAGAPARDAGRGDRDLWRRAQRGARRRRRRRVGAAPARGADGRAAGGARAAVLGVGARQSRR